MFQGNAERLGERETNEPTIPHQRNEPKESAASITRIDGDPKRKSRTKERNSTVNLTKPSQPKQPNAQKCQI
ncbi:hypothetical protein VTJ04DRAFT_8292 [Mycothermus thermophilus]|uniref:uncharacterized protein n=1 Tax=Humicola insolens TaxID=85995 RepID=UPI0037420E3B